MINRNLDEVFKNYENLSKMAWERFCSTRKRILSIDFTELDHVNDGRILAMYAKHLSVFFNGMNFANKYKICYNSEKIMYLFEVNPVKAKFGIEIPYRDHSLYQDLVCDINRLVDRDGCVLVYVDNNLYDLDAVLVIETNTNADRIKEIAHHNNLKIRNDIGVDQAIENMCTGFRNASTLPPSSLGDFLIKMLYSSCFQLLDKNQLQYYDSGQKSAKKKVFISYCHKDKAIVHEIEDAMESYGLNVWIDKKAIDYGDNIIEAVHNGISECDLAVIFLSCNTLNAHFANHELTVLYGDIINKTKNWFLINLDGVDVNQISHGLSRFLYYDYLGNPNKEELIKAIKNKLNKVITK